MEWSTAGADMGMVGRHIDSWVLALGELQQPSLHALRAAFGRYPLSTHLPSDVQQADGEIAGVPGCWFLPRERLPGRHIVYVHGGGFVCGDAPTYAGLCGRLAEATRMALLFVDYRRAPEHGFPAALDDVIAVLRAALHEGPHGPEPAQRLAVAGDSCGAGLALAAALALHAAGEPGPDAIVSFSGWFDLAELPPGRVTDAVVTRASMEGAVAAYAADKDLTDAALSPLRGDLAGLPPMLLQAGQDETLLPQSRELARRARAASIPVSLEILAPGLPHVAQIFWRELPAAGDAVRRAAGFLGGGA